MLTFYTNIYLSYDVEQVQVKKNITKIKQKTI